LDIIEELIQSGAQLSLRDSLGRGPLEVASFFKQQHIVDFFDDNNDVKSHK
jgi:ankyrin repeat protein